MKKLQTMIQLILHYFKKYATETLKDYSVLRGQDLVARLDDLIQKAQKVFHLKHQDAIEKCREFSIYKVPETQEHFSSRDDIPEAGERALIDKIDEIVYLSHFPMETKSFYMKADPEDPTRAWGVDVCFPGVGEIVGSGVREDSYEKLMKQLLDAKLDPKDYTEYLRLREYGFGKTSGMGLGVDRFLTWLLDMKSIREAVTFPRFPGCVRP
jgi:asparaginyl-tRNA synthetase